MIGYLNGMVKKKEHDAVLLVVGGVGYRVHVNAQTLGSLAEGTEQELYVNTVVKEDSIELYGFESQQELMLFNLLLGVNGVGPKSALGVLNIGVDACKEAIQHADVHVFSSVPRLGKKTAQKIIIELQPKLGELELLELGGGNTDLEEAVMALVGMGYDKHTVITAARKLPKDINTLDGMVKSLIKQLGVRHAK